jgi:hypothetical protein
MICLDNNNPILKGKMYESYLCKLEFYYLDIQNKSIKRYNIAPTKTLELNSAPQNQLVAPKPKSQPQISAKTKEFKKLSLVYQFLPSIRDLSVKTAIGTSTTYHKQDKTIKKIVIPKKILLKTDIKYLAIAFHSSTGSLQ